MAPIPKPDRDGVYRIKVRDEDICMALSPNGAVIFENPDPSDAKQQWNITLGPVPNTYNIANNSNNAGLTYTMDGEFSDAEDGYVICKSGSNTIWLVTERSGYSQISVHGLSSSDDAAGKVLDSCFPDKIIHFWPPNATGKRQQLVFDLDGAAASTTAASQIASISSDTTAFLEDGRYVLRNASNPVMVLDLSFWNTNYGNPLLVWGANYGANQKWDVKRQSDGTYTLASVHNGNCFIGYARDKPSRPVAVSGPIGWKLIPVEGTDDTFIISSPGGHVIDVKENGPATDKNQWLALHTLQADATQQKWQFEDTL